MPSASWRSAPEVYGFEERSTPAAAAAVARVQAQRKTGVSGSGNAKVKRAPSSHEEWMMI